MLSKKQRNRKQFFQRKALEKKIWIWYGLLYLLSHQFFGHIMELSIYQIYNNFFQLSQNVYYAMKKYIRVKKKKKNIINILNISKFFVLRKPKSESNSINSILQYVYVVWKDYFAVFTTSQLPYVILCPNLMTL